VTSGLIVMYSQSHSLCNMLEATVKAAAAAAVVLHSEKTITKFRIDLEPKNLHLSVIGSHSHALIVANC
jgi:hypothetical protein